MNVDIPLVIGDSLLIRKEVLPIDLFGKSIIGQCTAGGDKSRSGVGVRTVSPEIELIHRLDCFIHPADKFGFIVPVIPVAFRDNRRNLIKGELDIGMPF